MTLKQRLTALEHGPTELLTVFANVPAKWSASEAAQAIKAEALAQGYQAPFLTFPMPQVGAEGVAIVGSERMGEMIDYVAKHGGRIGQKTSSKPRQIRAITPHMGYHNTDKIDEVQK